MKILSYLFSLGLATCALCETCPSVAKIGPCMCEDSAYGYGIFVRCNAATRATQGFKRALKSLRGKKDVVLLLENLNLSKFSSIFFNGTDITTLFLSSCKIDSLANGEPVFLGLEDSLKKLTIQSSLTDKESPVKLRIGHLQNLKELNLVRNTISELSNDWLDDVSLSLKSISLIHNEIEKLGDRVFANLINVTVIDLGYNNLDSIQRSMFPNPAEELFWLNLQNNKLTDLPEDFFSNMPLLKTLSLFDNNISRLPERTWQQGWKRLFRLLLGGNPLVCDSHMNWMSELPKPTYVYGECRYREDKNRTKLSNFIKSIEQ